MQHLAVSHFTARSTELAPDYLALSLAFEVAFDTLSDDWDGDFQKSFIEPGSGNALTVQPKGGDYSLLRVACQKPGTECGTEELAVWLVLTSDRGRVALVSYEDGRTAAPTDVAVLTDLLWQAHRLAVEDRVQITFN